MSKSLSQDHRIERQAAESKVDLSAAVVELCGKCRAEIERLHARLEKRYEREREAHAANLIEQRRVEAENRWLREELKIADARSEKIAGTAARRTAEAWEEERKRLHAALRAARPCVFNSRHGGWEEALRLVDEALREESRGGPAECRP